IDRLEEQLGAPLFERVGRGIRLTPVGEALLHRARRISLMMDETAREIGDYAHGREGNIRLGCIPTLAEHILPGICQQLLAE
ncbi:LysR family transcriptional regulator, partial [Acinetobacter baumannii]